MASWFGSMAWPLAQKVLLGLGMGWLTYQAVNASMGFIQGYVVAQLGNIAGEVLKVLSLAGLMEGAGIVLGAIAARMALVVLGKLGKVTA